MGGHLSDGASDPWTETGPNAGWALGGFAIHASRTAERSGRAELGLVLGILAVLAGFLPPALTLGQMR